MDSNKFLKILVVGNKVVGKTSIFNRFINQEFKDKYRATVGSHFMSKKFDYDGSSYSLKVWDTSGLESFLSLCL